MWPSKCLTFTVRIFWQTACPETGRLNMSSNNRCPTTSTGLVSPHGNNFSCKLGFFFLRNQDCKWKGRIVHFTPQITLNVKIRHTDIVWPSQPTTNKWGQNCSIHEKTNKKRSKFVDAYWKWVRTLIPFAAGTKFKRLSCPWLPGLVNGHQFLHAVALDQCPGVLRVVGDDLVDGVEDRDHGVAL